MRPAECLSVQLIDHEDKTPQSQTTKKNNTTDISEDEFRPKDYITVLPHYSIWIIVKLAHSVGKLVKSIENCLVVWTDWQWTANVVSN